MLSEQECRTLNAFNALEGWCSAFRFEKQIEAECLRMDAKTYYETLDEISNRHSIARRDLETFFFQSLILRQADLQEEISRFVKDTCQTFDALHKFVKQEEQDRKDRLDCAKRSLEQYQHNDKFNGFVSFYHSVQEEYSPAEGGCWFIRRIPVACYPARNFLDRKTGGLDRGKLEAEAERLGLTLDGTEIDGRLAKIRSCAPEADCEAFLEQYPFEGTCLFAPKYE